MIRFFVVAHRWLGVVLCLFFAMWFASGMVMMYQGFPSLPDAERRARAPQVAAADVRVALPTLLAAADVGTVDGLRLVARDGRPLLIIAGRDGRVATVFADDGSVAALLTDAEARTIAERFAAEPAAEVTGLIDFDQWVVHQAFDRARPLFRVAINDETGTELYVSQRTGEVVQRTRRAERLWNYVGAVVHWIYPTVIRKNWALWDRLVWWLSLAGIAGAALGITLGIVRLRDARRRGRQGLASPFAGWLRWHHVLGLVTAAFVTTWIVSGWLSMDHGRLFPEPNPTHEQIDAFRGLTLSEAAARIPPAAFAALEGAREIVLGAVAGRPLVVAHYGLRSALLTPDAEGELVVHRLTDTELDAAVAAAWPGQRIERSLEVTADDAYGRLREGSLPPNTRRTLLADAGHTWIHVDRSTGEIVSVMSQSRRLYRWLFNGLHSADIPGLVERRPLWDVTMLTLLGAGLVFSITGVVIAYRRLGVTLRRR